MKDNIKGVGFDLDGTLYPNYRLRGRLILPVLMNLKLVFAFAKTRKIIRKEQENPAWENNDFYKKQAEMTAKLLAGTGSPDKLPDIIEDKIYRAWELPFKKIKLFKEVKETLAALREAGYKLGLLSDFPPEKKLEYLRLEGIWDAVQCSERSGRLKPHPLSLLELAEKMSLPPENILYVGNSHAYDVIGAKRAGMKTALIKPKYLPAGKKEPIPDFIFSDYRQLHNFMID